MSSTMQNVTIGKKPNPVSLTCLLYTSDAADE